MKRIRISPWQDGDPAPQALLDEMQQRRPRGELIDIDRLLLRSFPLAKGWNELLGRVRTEFSLSLEYRELIMLRVAVLNKASFEWQVHYPAYLQAGGDAQKASALQSVTINAEYFSETEALLLTLTDQSTQHVAVDAEVIARLKALLGDTQTVEAVATVAAYNMVSRFLVALNITDLTN